MDAIPSFQSEKKFQRGMIGENTLAGAAVARDELSGILSPDFFMK